MKNKSGGSFGIFAVLFAVVVLSIAGVVAFINENRLFTDKSINLGKENSINNENISQSDSSFASLNENSQSNNSSQPSLEETFSYVGLFKYSNAVLNVISFDGEYMEAVLTNDSISMEFVGQFVEGVLVAVGTDSNNNTVRVTVNLEEKSIYINTEPVIWYEENVPYLNVSGRFEK